ncbi:MAG: hypothetical protein JNL11_00525 [Bdellovibrionaceae bacterium]|nr:hypothetical protein [Pseudobdellovibrionaceae bacterium]
MTGHFKLFTLLTILVFVLNACTKKKSAGTKTPSPVVKNTDDGITAQLPLPAPSKDDRDDSITNADPQRTPTPGPTLNPANPDQTTESPAEHDTTVDGSIKEAPPAPNASTTTSADQKKATDLAAFQNCTSEKIENLMSIAKQKRPAGLQGPKMLTLFFTNTKYACGGYYSYNEEVEDIILAKLVESTLKHFPDSGQLVSFFTEVETNVRNKTMSEEQRNLIYDSFGSGVELESSGVQFFGSLEASKVSADSISFSFNRFTGQQTTRLFIDYEQTKSNTLDLKDTSTSTLRFVFDFSAKKGNLYKLVIMDGDTKIETYFDFVSGKGDMKKLRAGELVTISFAHDSWTSVIAHQLKKLVLAKSPQLANRPLSYTRTQTNNALSRTCTFNDQTIACTDPDYVGRASISWPELLQSIRK